jgi:hypothetical protein
MQFVLAALERISFRGTEKVLSQAIISRIAEDVPDCGAKVAPDFRLPKSASPAQVTKFR